MSVLTTGEGIVDVQRWDGTLLAGTNMVEDDGGGNSRWTAKALEQGPTDPGSNPWALNVADNQAAGTFGQAFKLQTGVSYIAGIVSAGAKNTLDDLNDLDAAGIRAAIGMAAADMDTQLGTISAGVAQAITDIGNLNDLDAAGIRAAIGMAAADMDVQLTAISNAIAALNDISSAEVRAEVLAALTTEATVAGVAMSESIRRIAAHYHQISGSPAASQVATDYEGTTITHTVDSNGNRTATYQ